MEPAAFSFTGSARNDSFMSDSDSSDTPKLVPLSANARRVLGVLVEKAKTVPDSYPMTLAAIVTASNQKSNRDPKMDLDEDDALLALDELREIGAAKEIQSSGRAVKYRHAAYEYLDIDSPQSAVMTELLLRGPQTSGELRSRASRMHSFENLAAIHETIDSLIAKGLVEALTPPGRGQTFAHTLYEAGERQHLPARVEKQAPAAATTHSPQIAAADQLVERLEKVNDRIDELEKRIQQLEQ